MNAEEFEKVFEWVTSQSRKVLVEKAAQYASDGDRMHNFKVAASFMGCTPEQALWGFLVKHLVSLQDMVQKDEEFPDEVWDEKVGDAVNYLILLRALVEDDPEVLTGLRAPPLVVNQTIINPPSSPANPGAYHDVSIPSGPSATD